MAGTADITGYLQLLGIAESLGVEIYDAVHNRAAQTLSADELIKLETDWHDLRRRTAANAGLPDPDAPTGSAHSS